MEGLVRVVAMAGDAGGARAVAPVVQRLQSSGNEVECRAYGAAREIWSQEGLRPLAPTLDVAGFSRVLLGTSVNPEQRELALLRCASAAGVRSVSVIDFWANYRERFTDGAGRIRVPTAIAVMDVAARDEAIAAGLPAERIVVTGQPAFDSLRDVRPRQRQIRVGVRSRSGISDAEIVVLYASQPLLQLYRVEELGFDPRDVLRSVVGALAAVVRSRGRTAVLLVKLHPRERSEPFTVPAAGSPELDVRLLRHDDIAPRELVAASDLVVGMSSALLMEACLIGTPALSYQPRLRVEDPLPANRFGWTASVTDPRELMQALDAELFDPRARDRRAAILRGIPLPEGATERVAQLVLRHE